MVLRNVIALRIELNTSGRKKCPRASEVAPFFRSSRAMPACHRLTEVARTKQDQASSAGTGGLCRACASCGTCHDHVAAQPSSRPTASPVMLVFASLVSTPGEVSFVCSALLCLRLGAQSSGAGGGNQTRPSQPRGVPVLPHACSETVNHPELLTGFVILNRA